MAVAFIEFGVSPGASSTSCVITKPTNLAVGNLMIAHIASASTTAISAPDVSWTQLQNLATTNGRGAAFYKQATSTDVAAASFTFTCGNADNKGTISTWSGHDTGTPIATSSGQANGNVANVTAPTITPIANCMIVLSGASISGARTFSGYAIVTSNPATWSEAYDTASTAVSVGCGYALRSQNTATGSGTIVKSGPSRNVGILLAIQPRGTTASTSSSSSSSSSNSSSSSSSSSRSSASSNSSSSKSSLSSNSSSSISSQSTASSNSSSSLSSLSSNSSSSVSSLSSNSSSSVSSPSSNSSSSLSSESSPSSESNSSNSSSSNSSPSSNSSSSISSESTSSSESEGGMSESSSSTEIRSSSSSSSSVSSSSSLSSSSLSSASSPSSNSSSSISSASSPSSESSSSMSSESSPSSNSSSSISSVSSPSSESSSSISSNSSSSKSSQSLSSSSSSSSSQSSSSVSSESSESSSSLSSESSSSESSSSSFGHSTSSSSSSSFSSESSQSSSSNSSESTSSSESHGGGWLPGWDRRIPIYVDFSRVTCNLSDFPVLLHLSASSGISTKDVTSIFNVLGSNSKKIAVTSADGVTETYVEIERWDYTGTPSTSSAWLWAKLPRITANENTYFYLYFDGSHADNTTYVGDTTSTPAKNVWTSSYISVYHLAELGSATIDEYKDSTVNSYDGQGGSGSIVDVPTRTTDAISGYAQNFIDPSKNNIGLRPSDDYIPYANSPISISCWFKATAISGVTDNDRIITFHRLTGGGSNIAIGVGSNNKIYIYNFSTPGDKAFSNTITAGVWYNVAITFDGTAYVFYFNGQFDSGYNGSLDAGSIYNAIMGGNTPITDNFNGIIDEVRISNTNLSACWVGADYYSGKDDFVTYENEEDLSSSSSSSLSSLSSSSISSVSSFSSSSSESSFSSSSKSSVSSESSISSESSSSVSSSSISSASSPSSSSISSASSPSSSSISSESSPSSNSSSSVSSASSPSSQSSSSVSSASSLSSNSSSSVSSASSISSESVGGESESSSSSSYILWWSSSSSSSSVSSESSSSSSSVSSSSVSSVSSPSSSSVSSSSVSSDSSPSSSSISSESSSSSNSSSSVSSVSSPSSSSVSSESSSSSNSSSSVSSESSLSSNSSSSVSSESSSSSNSSSSVSSISSPSYSNSSDSKSDSSNSSSSTSTSSSTEVMTTSSSSNSSSSSSSYILSNWNRLMIYSQAYAPKKEIAGGNNGVILVGEHQLFDQRSGDLGGICVNPSGEIYLADPIYHIILKVLMDGTVMVWAGQTGIKGNNGNNRVKGRDARFNEPSGLSCDKSGNLYVADRGNNQIRKITPDQYVTLVAGSTSGVSGFVSGIGSAARFNSPNDVSVDKSGNIYVADTNNHAVRLIKSGTSQVNTVAGNGTAGNGYNGWNADGSMQAILRYPYSIAAKPNGEVYIMDSGNFKIKLLDKNFRVLKFSGTGVEGTYLGDPVTCVGGVCVGPAQTCQYCNMRYSDVDPSGNLYVVDYKDDLNSRLLKINGNGIPAIVRNFVDLNDNWVWEDGNNATWEDGNNAIWEVIVTVGNNYVAGVAVNNSGFLFVTESQFGGE